MINQGMDLTVCIDFKSLDAFLGLGPTLAMQAELGVTLDWLPFTRGMNRYSNENKLPDMDDAFENFKIRRQKIRDEYRRLDKTRYAKLIGLSEEDLEQSCDSSLAAMGLLWMKNSSYSLQCSYISGVFDAFFREHQDLGDLEVIAKVVKAIGGEFSGFKDYVSSEGKVNYDSLQDELGELGVFSTPTYLMKGEIFQGRQHLPLIKWHLSGQEGAPPV